MGIDQPFENEPSSEDDYIINETTELDEKRDNERYVSWEFETDKPGAYKGRAISRTGKNITVMILEPEEFDQFEAGNHYWTEMETSSEVSVYFHESLKPGEYVLVVTASEGGGWESNGYSPGLGELRVSNSTCRSTLNRVSVPHKASSANCF